MTLDDRGRLTLPKEMRERYGDRYRVVELHDGIKLVPIAEHPLSALREEFAEVDKPTDSVRRRVRRRSKRQAAECTRD